MKKILTMLLAAGAMLTAAAQTKEYPINIGDFSELRVDNSIRVDYYWNPDSAGRAVIVCSNFESPDQIILNRNNKGHVRIQTNADVARDAALPSVRIYSTGLTHIANSGDSLVKVHSLAPVKKLKAVLIDNGRLVVNGIVAEEVNASLETGCGTLIVEGECTTAKLRNVGSGTIEADRLKALNVNASVYGSGSIGCDPSESLSIGGLALGAGTVYYRSIPALPIKMRTMGVKCEPLR